MLINVRVEGKSFANGLALNASENNKVHLVRLSALLLNNAPPATKPCRCFSRLSNKRYSQEQPFQQILAFVPRRPASTCCLCWPTSTLRRNVGMDHADLAQSA
jgi:hypothetical protein